jgi:hypothetical protein
MFAKVGFSLEWLFWYTNLFITLVLKVRFWEHCNMGGLMSKEH